MQLTLSGVDVESMEGGGVSVVQRSRKDDVREEEIPAFVAPEDLQAKQGFIPLGAPELATAFHPTLHLPTG